MKHHSYEVLENVLSLSDFQRLLSDSDYVKNKQNCMANEYSLDLLPALALVSAVCEKDIACIYKPRDVFEHQNYLPYLFLQPMLL